MPTFDGLEWWKATEIPLSETDWRNVRLYCEKQREENPFGWERCVYGVRLSPPFAIHYGDDDAKTLITPLVYVGSGAIETRWSGHREWLEELAYAIPGGRYEVWVCRPRLRGNDRAYAGVEGYLLNEFRARCGYLPLRNFRIESHPEHHEYDPAIFTQMTDADRRYFWAIWPRRKPIEDWYYKGLRE